MAQTALKRKIKPAQSNKSMLQVGISLMRRLMPLVSVVVLLAVWQIIVMLEVYPRFIIPAPLEVWEAFLVVLGNGTLFRHIRVTGNEVLLGLFFGLSTATLIGYLIAKVPILEDILSPVIVGFQSTPVVAYAPLLIIWFGSGTLSKVITCAVIVFFPTLMNTIVGVRNVPQNLRDLMRSMNATPMQVFTKLELPAAMPVLLTGLKTSVTLAVIGAVVGEFVSAQAGLGFLVTQARSQFNTPLVLVAVFTMTALALSLYFVISLIERVALHWQRRIAS